MVKHVSKKAEAEAEIRARLPEVEEEWEGVVAGGKVKVKGLRGVFTFISARVDHGEVKWLNVVGPVGARSSLRSFDPGRVTKK